MGEINKQLATAPRDPSLRYELGMILRRNGQEPKGLLWLASALREDPQHRPTLQALADYYEHIGQPRTAERYRKRIQALPK